MKKLIQFLLATSMLLCGFVATTNAATVRDSEGPSNRAYYDACDQIFRVGEYGMFARPNSDVAVLLTVNKVDAAADKIYCDQLGAWLPAYSLTEADPAGHPAGDQILRVGEKFIIANSPDNLSFNGHKESFVFKIYNVDAPSDSVQIHLMDKWGKINAVWVYAAPMYEFSPHAC